MSQRPKLRSPTFAATGTRRSEQAARTSASTRPHVFRVQMNRDESNQPPLESIQDWNLTLQFKSK